MMLFWLWMCLALGAAPAMEEAALALDAQAEDLYVRGRYVEALEVAEQSLALRREHQPGSFEMSQSLSNLALVHWSLGQIEPAVTLFEECLAIREALVGTRHPATAQTLNFLANVLVDAGRREEAGEAYLRALDIFRETLKEGHPAIATVLNDLASLRASQGALLDAQALYAEALGLRRARLGPEHPLVAYTLVNMASLAVKRIDYEQAAKWLEQALAILTAAKGTEHPDTIGVLGSLAQVRILQGRYSEALQHARQAVAAARTAEVDPGTLGSVLRAQVTIERRLGHYETARALAMESLELAATLPEDRAEALALLVDIEIQTGDYKRALAFVEEAIAVHRALDDGAEGEAVGSLLQERSYVERSLGDLQAAERSLRRALEIIADLELPDPSLEVATLGTLAMLEREQGNLDEALALLERSREPAGQLAPQDIAHAVLASRLALIHRDQGALDQAEAGYLEALDDVVATGGDPDIQAATLNNLGLVLLRQGRVEEAAQRFEQSLEQRLAMHGDNHPDVAQSRINLAHARWLLGAHDEARALATEALRVRERHLDLVGALSDRTGADYLAEHLSTLSTWLTLHERPEDGLETWRHLLTWKGAVTRSLAARSAAARTSTAAAQRDRWQELVDTRRELKEWMYAAYEPAQAEAQRARVDELTARKEVLEEELAELAPIIEVPDPARLCAAMPRRARWLELFRYQVDDELQLMALVVDPQCRVRRVALGPAARAEAIVAAWRDALSSASLLASRRGEAAYTAIWAPLAGTLAGARELWVVPDGELATLPWPALPIGDGRLFVERFAVRVLGSGAVTPATRAPGSGLLTVGDVDYGDAPSEAGGDCPARTFRPLDGTGRESAQLAADWPARLGPVTRLRGATATPETVLAEATGQRVVHLATHGFFAPQACAPRAQAGRDNPMLLSGLALAGANESASGLLSAEELAGEDLRGVELVVLSACETALGDTSHAGEGVQGLQRGFALAGAGTVVMSLWKVPDDATAQLMEGFMRRWAQRRSPARALQQTQLTRLRAERRASGEAQAWRWAAWVVGR